MKKIYKNHLSPEAAVRAQKVDCFSNGLQMGMGTAIGGLIITAAVSALKKMVEVGQTIKAAHAKSWERDAETEEEV